MRALRQSYNTPMGELACYLGISVPYLSDVERGRRAPFNVQRVKRIADFFRVDPMDLLRAQAETRGFFELAAREVSQRHLEVGTKLVQKWASLSQDALSSIQAVVLDAHKRIPIQPSR